VRRSGRSTHGRDAGLDRFCPPMEPQIDGSEARAVIGTDGAVWNANQAFCALVGLDEPALRHLGWRQLVHASDRRYVAAHLVEVLAGGGHLREFDVRLALPTGGDVPTRLRVELVRDSEGRQGWFLMEAWATT
jgi:PAS domain S-box-containing protein